MATGLSFMNMMNMIGIALAQPLVGYFLDQLWQGQIDHDIRIYSLQAYQQALSLLPLGLLLAMCFIPFIREVSPKAIAKNS